MIILKFIKKTLKWIVAAFFASTILSVVLFRFLPVWVTPLMVIRCCQQVSDGKKLKLSHDWEPLENISPSLPVAVMASEDARFLEHHGFDYKAIEHAAKRNREHPEKRKLGASTITHMVVYGPGGYRFSDFIRIGLLMNLIILAANIFIVNIVYPLTPLQ